METGRVPGKGSGKSIIPLPLAGLPSAPGERQGRGTRRGGEKGLESPDGSPGAGSIPRLLLGPPSRVGGVGPDIIPPVSSTHSSRLAGLGVGKGKAQWDRGQQGGLSRRKSSAAHTVPCPVLRATWGGVGWDDRGQGQAHLTYLCVGGLAQWVVAMPDDRYLSLRRSMRRTFTKSLGGGRVRSRGCQAQDAGAGGLPERRGVALLTVGRPHHPQPPRTRHRKRGCCLPLDAGSAGRSGRRECGLSQENRARRDPSPACSVLCPFPDSRSHSWGPGQARWPFSLPAWETLVLSPHCTDGEPEAQKSSMT